MIYFKKAFEYSSVGESAFIGFTAIILQIKKFTLVLDYRLEFYMYIVFFIISSVLLNLAYYLMKTTHDEKRNISQFSGSVQELETRG